ncbi:MAG TPA: ester cyclase, partial [Gemmatimonadales bacterium]|nr:ester cyclase [Gemmatimonadales bacterium]
TIGALALVLGVAVAWTSPAAAQDAEQNKALYTVVVNQVFNHGDLALADDLIAKDVTHNGSPFGRASFKNMVKEMRDKAPGSPYAVADLIADGDRVVGRLTRGGAPAEIVVLRIQDGQVVEHWSMADEPSLRAQFGLNAPTGAASAPN